MSRIFLSHSSKNNAEVRALQQWLKDQGVQGVFVDNDPDDGLKAGKRWDQALAAEIQSCKLALFLLSPDWCESTPCSNELAQALIVKAHCIGVIIKAISADRIPNGLGGPIHHVNLAGGRKSLTYKVAPSPDLEAIEVAFPEEGLRKLRASLQSLGLVGYDPESFVWPPESEPERSPFRGLDALDSRDAGIFFGRDADLARAREHLLRLREQGSRRLFAIQGNSGSGKSSFMRAGLMPRLERDEADFVVLSEVRPGRMAISGPTGMGAALEQIFAKLGQPKSLGEILATLERSNSGLLRLLGELQQISTSRLVGVVTPQVQRPPTLVIPIDQAEELFARDAGKEAEQLSRHLVTTLTSGPETLVLITIRYDLLPLLEHDSQLNRLVEPFNLFPLDSTSFRDAILRPAARTAPPTKIDPQLVDAIVKDTAIAAGADPLPLLAFTMQLLYSRHRREPNGLLLEHYNAIHGIGGSIDQALELARQQVGASGTNVNLRRILVPGLATWVPKANAPKRLPEVPECNIIGGGREYLAPLVGSLVSNRLLARGRGTLEVAHEALLRRAPILNWLKQQKDELTLRDDLLSEATKWEEAGRPSRELARSGKRLALARTLAANADYRRELAPARRYLAACRSRDTTRMGRAVVLAAAVLSGVTTTTWWPWVEVKAYRIRNVWSGSSAGLSVRDCPNCPELVILPTGSFIFAAGTKAAKHIEVTEQMAVAKYPATIKEWNHYCLESKKCATIEVKDKKDNMPVRLVSRQDARDYAKWISLKTSINYKLLSDVQWEFAARGITSDSAPHTRYPWGDEINPAQSAEIKRRNGELKPVEVGSWPANGFRLNDMWTFNVREWTDCDSTEPPIPGSIPGVSNPVTMGISNQFQLEDLKFEGIGYRTTSNDDRQQSDVGFRLYRYVNSRAERASALGCSTSNDQHDLK